MPVSLTPVEDRLRQRRPSHPSTDQNRTIILCRVLKHNQQSCARRRPSPRLGRLFAPFPCLSGALCSLLRFPYRRGSFPTDLQPVEAGGRDREHRKTLLTRDTPSARTGTVPRFRLSPCSTKPGSPEAGRMLILGLRCAGSSTRSPAALSRPVPARPSSMTR